MADNDNHSKSSEDFPISFDKMFFDQYANRLTNDPELAINEMISNCWDAAANRVDIEWAQEQGGKISISDDGWGMTYDEFKNIWSTLSYQRPDKGKLVSFPGSNNSGSRKVLGANGKGRFSMFCFDHSYTVVTAKNGEKCEFRVDRLVDRKNPFSVTPISREPSEDRGTVISCSAIFNYIDIKKLAEVVASKFFADPSFHVYINNQFIQLTEIDHLRDKTTLETNYGVVDVFEVDVQKLTKSTQQNGVAWWVNRKSVGKNEWHDPNRKRYLDARKSVAKRYGFIVEADILDDMVEFDWTGFIESDKTNEVIDVVNEHITQRLNTLMANDRDTMTKSALESVRSQLKELPPPTRKRVRQFSDGIQKDMPTLDQKILNQAVTLFTTMEEARLGYQLLQQLSQFDTDDVDAWSQILEKWSAKDAQIVLEELYGRLKLISELEKVIEADSNELHVIHPLFNGGLWIFGPEYESASFMSNRWLKNVIRNLIKDQIVEVDRPSIRPDIVALPDGELDIFSIEHYGSNRQRPPDKSGWLAAKELSVHVDQPQSCRRATTTLGTNI